MKVSKHGPDGLLSRDQLALLHESGEIETVLVVVPDFYGRLMGKRLTSRFFLESVASHGMHICDYLVACDIEMDPVPGYQVTSWETGYGDFLCVPDFSTLRHAAWLEKTALVLCDLKDAKGSLVDVAPRRILARQIELASQSGILPQGGSEIELYVFAETYDSDSTASAIASSLRRRFRGTSTPRGRFRACRTRYARRSGIWSGAPSRARRSAMRSSSTTCTS